jgi:hypothetical protein
VETEFFEKILTSGLHHAAVCCLRSLSNMKRRISSSTLS